MTGNSKADTVRVERGRARVEEVIKTKDAISVWVHLFEACGNNRTGLLRGQRGSIFLSGREPGFVLNKVIKGKIQRRG